jgi:chloramphenicol-sensitive protein RarD
VRQTQRGLGYALAAYATWGLFPLYWPLLEPAPAVQILAHRMVWSLVFVGVVLLIRRRWAFVGQLWRDRRRLGLLVLAAVLVSVNWGIYIWAVNAGHVVETSLGYFINPLVNIALGVWVLRERLRPVQWIAVAVAGAAVVVITVDYGRLPWIALSLAVSFGGYGLVKKVVGVPALESLAAETVTMAPFAVIFLVAVELRGTGAFGHVALGTNLLLVAAGAVTAIPLLWFAAAARRVPLSVMGLLQYITPVLQFMVGVFIRHEPLPTSELIGFCLVWVALLILGGSEAMQWRGRQRVATDDSDDALLVMETP